MNNEAAIFNFFRLLAFDLLPHLFKDRWIMLDFWCRNWFKIIFNTGVVIVLEVSVEMPHIDTICVSNTKDHIIIQWVEKYLANR